MDKKEEMREAKLLFENPIFKKVFDDLEKVYWTEWRNTLPEQKDEREWIYRGITVLKDVLHHIKIIADGGYLSTEDLKRMKGKGRK